MIQTFLLIVLIVITFFVAMYNSPRFPGFARLPVLIDELVYSFFYTKEPYPVPTDFHLSPASKYHTVINPQDNVSFSILEIPSPSIANKKRPLIIWLRGNGKIEYRLEAIKMLQDKVDVDVALINYRGSFQDLSRDQVYRSKLQSDNRVAMQYIRSQFDFESYYVYGLSIGSAIASDMVLDDLLMHTDYRFKGVILDNVFTSLASSFVVNIQNSSIPQTKYLPSPLMDVISKTASQGILAFCGETYLNKDTWSKIRQIVDQRGMKLPLLVFSSGKDQIMNPNDGMVISNIMPSQTTKFVLVKEADHGSVTDWPIFYEKMVEFLSQA